jgi:hypothetical protein
MIHSIFISGKVTGESAILCYHKFMSAEDGLKKTYPAAKIYNPMRICKTSDRWLWAMCKTLFVIVFLCDAVYFLPDYEQSRGAMIEYRVAGFLGKMII